MDVKNNNKNVMLNSNPFAYAVQIDKQLLISFSGTKSSFLIEQKLLVNKNCKTLEELRQSFKHETSSVLSQVRDFLPKIATANQELQKQLENEPAGTYDIEQIDSDKPHIEMDLALFEEDDSASEDSEDESDDSDCDISELNENNLKLSRNSTNTKQAPVIEVVSETNLVDAD